MCVAIPRRTDTVLQSTTWFCILQETATGDLGGVNRESQPRVSVRAEGRGAAVVHVDLVVDLPHDLLQEVLQGHNLRGAAGDGDPRPWKPFDAEARTDDRAGGVGVGGVCD